MNYSKVLERKKKSIGNLQGRLENGFGRRTVSSLCQKFIIRLRRIQGNWHSALLRARVVSDNRADFCFVSAGWRKRRHSLYASIEGRISIL